MDTEKAQYWSRARAWARAHTKTYTLPKAVPPILAALGQFVFSRKAPMSQILLTVLIILGGYLMLYGLEFCWNLLFRAPMALYGESEQKVASAQAEVRALMEKAQAPKRTLAEEHRHRIVVDAIEKYGETAKAALRHLRHQRTVTITSYPMSGNVDCSSVPSTINAKQFGGVLSQLVAAGVVRRTTEPNTPQLSHSVFEITPVLLAAMDEVLYTESKF